MARDGVGLGWDGGDGGVLPVATTTAAGSCLRERSIGVLGV